MEICVQMPILTSAKINEPKLHLGLSPDNIICEWDKHITLTYRKEKKTSRTYISGIDNFIDDVPTFCKTLKQKLGTGSNIVNDNGNIMYGFQGNMINRIYDILIAKGIDSDKIKK